MSDHSPQHTLDHRNCPACEALRQEKLEPEKFGLLYFRQAAPYWLDERKDELSIKSVKDYKYFFRPLIAFFGEIPLNEIHIGNVQAYIDQRLSSQRKTTSGHSDKLVGPTAVRHEISALRQILERAGLWQPIGERYKPPRMPKSTVGQALEPEQEQMLLTVASSNPRWSVAYWGTLLTVCTTSDHGEIRHIHLSDINLNRRTMRIREGIKNEHRDRTPILNDEAIWAVGKILKRYFRICKRLGIQPHPEHYILPGRHRGQTYDPTIPMGSWKKAWAALCDKAGFPGLRMKDLRHHAQTKLLENPELSERAIIETTGHVDKAMWKVYSHIRRRPLEQAAEALRVQLPHLIAEPDSPLPSELVEIVDGVENASKLTESLVPKK